MWLKNYMMCMFRHLCLH